MDNARTHHSVIFKQFIEDNKLNIIYNVPYRPEFNPIEKVFSKIKFLIRSKNNNNDGAHLTKKYKRSINKNY